MARVDGISTVLLALFEPQVEQLDVSLERQGNLWVGTAVGNVAEGTMWLCSPAPHCLVLCHDVAPSEDMSLFEGSLSPYACACAMGEHVLACSQNCGLAVRPIRPKGTRGSHREETATFVEPKPRSLTSHLVAGRVYRSRSLIFLPGYFEELDRRYPEDFRRLFPAFGRDWSGGAKIAIQRALDAVPMQPPLCPGGELVLLSTVTSLMASLSTYLADNNHDAEELVDQAKALLAAAVEGGVAPPSVSQLAQELYVSRSKLCDVFRSETGQSVGVYARRLRLERACCYLEDEGLAIADIAGMLGYSNSSAFCHAFVSAMGISPRAWRKSEERGAGSS